MSCLFQSLGCFIKVCPEELRGQICRYLTTDPVLISPDLKVSDVIKFQPDIPSMSLAQYVQLMSIHSTNGGAIEIRAFCNIYKVNVRVVQCGVRRTEKHIEFINDITLPWITVSWDGGHYEPVQLVP